MHSAGADAYRRHAGFSRMKLLPLTVLGAIVAMATPILIVAAPSAFAFQESQSGAPASAPAGKAEPQTNFETDSATKPSVSGTAVKIPGLGTLGVLPKMDFGLELLYGAAGDKGVAPTEPAAIGSDDDELRLRGTVRHKF